MNRQDKKVRELGEKMQRILELVEQQGGLIAGSLYTARTKCGRETCKCMKSDYRHANRCLSFKDGGRSRTRTIPDELAEEIRERTEAYRQAKALRKAMAAVSAELLEDISRIIADSARKGQRDMLSALAKARKEAK
jgi:hypothetical protein